MLSSPPIGLSDHDVVYIEADIWLRKVRQQPRKILRYDKANWDNIKFDLEDTLKKIININNDAKSTVNEMWNLFKNNLTKSINKNIPHQMLTYKHRLPWVHNKLRKMINKKNKIYFKMKKYKKYKEKYKFLNKFHISFTVLFASLFMFIIFLSVSSKSDLMLS
jgi:hypothetical protein